MVCKVVLVVHLYTGIINFIPAAYLITFNIIIKFFFIQGVVSDAVLHQVLVAQLPGAKTEESIQALHSTALQVATGSTPSMVDYIKLMTPVNTLILLSFF